MRLLFLLSNLLLLTNAYADHPCEKALLDPISNWTIHSVEIEFNLAGLPLREKPVLVGDGNTNPYLVVLSDGTKAIFKPKSDHWASNPSSEVASYQISRFFGFNLVPPTVFRSIDGESGSMQLFVENTYPGNTRSIRANSDDLFKQHLLDYILENTDRQEGRNYLLTSHGRVISIDHGTSFYVNSHTPRVPTAAAVGLMKPDHSEIVGKIKHVTSEDLLSLTKGLLTEKQFESFKIRIDTLKKEIVEIHVKGDR